ncbi:Vacuole effluxer Atg22 like protein [Methyloligella halotolerans]|uniref:Vacuole effluxer Atg22 like protein n=1 Tax=Methyloligella halotolerans TaxID=1177755 RepID=A0A1E2S0T4_9HYPH|nr:MFS transporter [Methyloligella halotolerans]ODA67948.1 Vacuole effluxer Atg22 like protein [Methyloligella halotolerans]
MAKLDFTQQERAEIAQAISRAESRTSGEIVVIVTDASDGYRSFTVLWSALIALAVPLPLMIFTDWGLDIVYSIQLFTFLALLPITQVLPIRMALVPRRIKHARAHAKALEQFLAQNLHTTMGRTGVLFFVSVAERFAEVIADEAVYEKVEPQTWKTIIDGFTARIGQGDRIDAFNEAISSCGDVLARHFPPGGMECDELPNHLIVLDGAAPSSSGPVRARGLFGWVMFDWATQPFYTLVVTFLFAPYFVNGFAAEPILAASLWGYATGFGQLFAALLAPILGGYADSHHQPRKPWIALFSAVLIVSLCVLWLADPVHPDRAILILVAFGIALMAAELATVFNNAMMPDLVTGRSLGKLSGTGWAVGYVGGLVSLVIVAGLLVSDPATDKTLLGLDPLLPLDAASREGDRLIGPFSALWYLVFVLPLFFFTPDRPRRERKAAPVPQPGLYTRLRQLVKDHPQTALFLLARMLYADGLGAIFAFGGIYAASVFGWQAAEMGVFGIILVVTAALGAWIGGHLDDRFGPKRVIAAMLLLLIVGTVGVLSIDKDEILFVLQVPPKETGAALFASAGEKAYLVFAMLIGIASGPIQAASRTLMVRVTPAGQITEFFGFFAFSGKVTAFAAPLAIGAVTYLADSQRVGIATSVAFLLAGLWLLMKVRLPASAAG